jgi:hypothetical protein
METKKISMSPMTKKLFVSILSFLVLVLSWWNIGTTVAREAVAHDGQWFETSFLNGQYFNDRLPVFTALGFGLGWIVAMVVVSKIKSENKVLLTMLLVILGIGVFYFLFSLLINQLSESMVTEVLDLTASMFLPGGNLGMLMGVLRKFDEWY